VTAIKLRNFNPKLISFPNEEEKRYKKEKNLQEDKPLGYYPCGEWLLEEGILKMGEVRKLNGETSRPLFKQYKAGETVNLPERKAVDYYFVVCCSELSPKENRLLLKNYCHSLSNSQKASFCEKHMYQLNQVLGKKEFNSFMLEIIFHIGYIPDRFELTYAGNKNILNPKLYKQEWIENKNQFKVLMCK